MTPISFAFGHGASHPDPMRALERGDSPECTMEIDHRRLHFDATLLLRRFSADCALSVAERWPMPPLLRDILTALDLPRYRPARHFIERDAALASGRARQALHTTLQALSDDVCAGAFRAAASSHNVLSVWRSRSDEPLLDQRIKLHNLLTTGALWAAGFDPDAPLNARLVWCRDHQEAPTLLGAALLLWERYELDGRPIADSYLSAGDM